MNTEHEDFGVDPEERSEILESLLEAIGVPFLVVGADLRLLFFSQRAASLFGLSLSDVGRPVEDILPGGRDSQALRAVEQAIMGMRRSYTEIQVGYGTWYGQRVQILESPDGGSVGAVLTYFRVAAHTGSDRDTESLLGLYESILSHSPDIIVRLDRHQRFVYVNAAAAAMVGLDAEEMLGKSAWELGLTGEMARFLSTEVEQVILTGEPLSETVPVAVHGKGTNLFWRLLPELNELGTVDAVLSVATDVTPLVPSFSHGSM
ncbi:MAG: PAS domain-containing protein [Spirochaetia bacterium]